MPPHVHIGLRAGHGSQMPLVTRSRPINTVLQRPSVASKEILIGETIILPLPGDPEDVLEIEICAGEDTKARNYRVVRPQFISFH